MYCAPIELQDDLSSHSNAVPTLLHQYFEHQAQLRPNAVAVEYAGGSLSYADLDQMSNQFANYMVDRGLKTGDLVGIYLKKSPRLYAVMLAILKAGAGYVPIDPRFPLERIDAIADDAKWRFLVSEDALADVVAGSDSINVLRLDRENDAIQAASEAPLDKHDIGSDDLSYVIYTSGSTGRPKGVMIAHRNAMAFVNSLEPVYQLDENDRVYQGFSVAFDASVEEIWAAFALGGTLVVPTEDIERSPADVAEFINKNRITYYSTVPTMLAMIEQDLPSVRTLVLGGEACSNELVSRWAISGRRMLNTYGPTEATVVATWSECHADVPVNIGKALPGYTTHVLDENGHPVSPGEDGELYIGGAGVGRGYMNLPEMTSTRFVPNRFDVDGNDVLYRTYDHVRLSHDGDLHFLGRLDDQVKIRGFRIELSEIQSVLISQPEIAAAAVGVIEVTGLQELAAYIILRDGLDELDRKNLAAALRATLPSYMVPKYLDIVDALPTMPSGKIDRKQLPVPQNLLKGTGTIVEAADAVEQVIADAWQACFKLPALSVEADFFTDLGGHSLLASQCINRLRKRLPDVAVSVRDIYENRNVRALSMELRSRGLSDASIDVERSANESNTTSFESGFDQVPAYVRYCTVAVQSLVVMLYCGIVAAPLTYLALMYAAVQSGDIGIERAIHISIIAGFAVWPSMLLLSIVIKWTVIGRYKPGRYPVWGTYYLRWWIVSRFQALSWSSLFIGTPLMSIYYRAMGAKIGRNVTLCTPHCTAFDVVTVGDGASIGLESQMLGHRVEDGYLIIAPVAVGKNCFVGMHCSLGLDVTMGDGARLDDMSLLSDDTTVVAGEGWRGAPARQATIEVPPPQSEPASSLRAFVFGALHLLLVYAMGYFLMAVSLPALVLLVVALYYWGVAWAALAVFAAVPLFLATYTAGAVLLMRLLGKPEETSYPLHSGGYLRHWFSAFLMENTRTVLRPVYATMYFPALIRALGAKVGKGSEVSTVSHITPHLVEVGNGCFLADGCIIGGQRIHGGTMELRPVRIEEKTFIGNSALVPGGCNVGSNVLIGVGSIPPVGARAVPASTRWLGSPSFELPNTQKPVCFEQEALFVPGRAAILERACTDAIRVVAPGIILTLFAVALLGYLIWAYEALPLSAAIVSVPPAAFAITFALVAVTAGIKHLLLGTLGPVVKPLWCRFVWRNELLNGIYESVAASAMAPLLGTPLASVCLRMMGCRIGKWCFIETTLFSEFDLVQIGDRVALNLGATVQTHLFEDRVFKADRLSLGNDCSIGNMAIVLYSTSIEEGAKLGSMSVLMKGETLPALTHWAGIPCERIGPSPSSRHVVVKLADHQRSEIPVGATAAQPAF
ncbi:MAG: non-ribosomal peptide synthetase-like protein [Alphaproteobacteria bacterium]|jgi:non-ribosomal peptide synthetase-like protein